MPIEFEWDEDKALANFAKHGILFEEAVTVFADPNAVTMLDEGHSLDEQRFTTIGISERLRVLLVVHCERGVRVRIISARRATAPERRLYEKT